jgi:phosphoribosyl 1,2-cyclic phosphodiesterase
VEALMRFCSLGSGSGGNATIVEAGDGSRRSRVVIDCGFSLREFEARLGRVGLAAEALDAVFITHEHGDHIGCAVTLARRYRLPIWMSHGTWRAIGAPELPGQLSFARDGESVAIGALQLTPYTVPHDAQEPLQLRCSDGASDLGLLTDAGSITTHLLAHLQNCDALLLECNHDAAMLAASRYPESLKSRIGGRLGHLSNDTAARILAQCLHPRLRHLVAAHLSEQNNQPQLVRAALAAVAGGAPGDIVIADPAQGFGWLALR